MSSSEAALPLLPMRPFFVEKLWGGARLRELPAKARAGHAPPSGRIGESWEVADIAEGTSVVDDGPMRGMTLREAVAAHGRALTGGETPASADGMLRFPLLVKLIDADDDLSVQVHPDHAWASSHPGTFSKDEAWLVVHAAPGARMLHGLKPGVSRVQFEDAIRTGRAQQLLREVHPRAGDVLHIPPGTVHAVGRGCLLLEVQEPSDTTFRVFDYDRVDAHGNKRALHVQEALAVTRFGEQPPPFVSRGDAGTRPSLEAARFSLAVIELADDDNAGVLRPSVTPRVLFALDSEVTLASDGARVTLPRGGSCIVPPGVAAHARGSARARLALMAPRT